MTEEIRSQEISPEEEIRRLEEKLKEKKLELGKNGEAREEKESLKEILKERIEEARHKAPAGQGASQAAADDTQKRAAELKSAENAQYQLEALVQIALNESLVKAVRTAEAIGPYMLDLLHDTLVDHYYEKLLAARQIKPA